MNMKALVIYYTTIFLISLISITIAVYGINVICKINPEIAKGILIFTLGLVLFDFLVKIAFKL